MWQHGGAYAHPLVILKAVPNGRSQSRVAFVVSKKVGQAVTRNRAKRLMREATRKRFPRIVEGYDLVFIARRDIPEASLAEVSNAIDQVLSRARLLKQE